MVDLERGQDNTPRTLKDHNESVKFAFDILSGKEFRRLKRKQQRKN